MTRKEQIIKAAKQSEKREGFTQIVKDAKGVNSAYGIGFLEGAIWADCHLWKPADGDDLPEIDREVIALLKDGMVVFAHRPPEYWNGKNIITNEVTRYEPKRYDNGGWNQPNVVWWLDLDLPIKGE
jgi:hypothetical protein